MLLVNRTNMSRSAGLENKRDKDRFKLARRRLS